MKCQRSTAASLQAPFHAHTIYLFMEKFSWKRYQAYFVIVLKLSVSDTATRRSGHVTIPNLGYRVRQAQNPALDCFPAV